jgi:RNA polymerase sigma-70 factor, ECF subfamily
MLLVLGTELPLCHYHETTLTLYGFSPIFETVCPFVRLTREWRPGAGVDSEERQLVQRCLARDQAACTDLVKTYSRVVGTVIWRATGDSAVVEDLAQETFLRVFRGLPYFAARAKLSTWIYTIAHRVAIDHLRTAGRRPDDDSLPMSGEERAMPSVEQRFASAVISPETAVMRKETQRLVRGGLAELPDKYRLPLVYSAIDGLDYGTIGVMLGAPVGTVKTLVFRGKRMLRELISVALERRTEGQRGI